jgi:hypothetical protein
MPRCAASAPAAAAAVPGSGGGAADCVCQLCRVAAGAGDSPAARDVGAAGSGRVGEGAAATDDCRQPGAKRHGAANWHRADGVRDLWWAQPAVGQSAADQ